jgi:hypothetical protein
MVKNFFLSMLVTGALVCLTSSARAQAVPSTQRFPQTIIVNGQQAEGVIVLQNGTTQTFSCPNPKPYMTVDQSSSGWACFDQGSGSWLLNAAPPRSSVYQEPLPFEPNDADSYYDPYPYPS